MSSSRLCSPCQALLEIALDQHDYAEFTHYDDGSAFIKMAETNSCYFCTWAWRSHRNSVDYHKDPPPAHRTVGAALTRYGRLSSICIEIFGVQEDGSTMAHFKLRKRNVDSKSYNMLALVLLTH